MSTEEVFKEVLNSPELQAIFQISKEELENENLYEKSNYPVIEIIKTLIIGQKSYKSAEQIFQTIQKQIIQI